MYLYSISIYFLKLGIIIHSFFNKKSKKWLAGRKNLFAQLDNSISKNDHPIWIHCASLGEFEQGRPLIEKIKEENSSKKILLTFFSPSGYEIRKNYKYADYIYYLPLDTKSNARKFLKIVQPSMVIFVKYEFWLNFLNSVSKRKIPLYLISANFRENQIFFKFYGKTFLNTLKKFTHIFVQSEHSKSILNQFKISQISVAGDTRIDRVYQISKKIKPLPLIESFCEDKKIFIAGSSWEKDELIISKFIKEKNPNQWKFIIAPHDISKTNIDRLLKLFKPKNVLKYSQLNLDLDLTEFNILVIDNIGLLSSIYQYGKIAYIGGGFGTGIHNTLEPITFKLPVIFGPNHLKFDEAKTLVTTKGGFTINNYSEFSDVMESLFVTNHYNNASDAAYQYILKNVGATDKIYEAIRTNL